MRRSGFSALHGVNPNSKRCKGLFFRTQVTGPGGIDVIFKLAASYKLDVCHYCYQVISDLKNISHRSGWDERDLATLDELHDVSNIRQTIWV